MTGGARWKNKKTNGSREGGPRTTAGELLPQGEQLESFSTMALGQKRMENPSSYGENLLGLEYVSRLGVGLQSREEGRRKAEAAAEEEVFEKRGGKEGGRARDRGVGCLARTDVSTEG